MFQNNLRKYWEAVAEKEKLENRLNSELFSEFYDETNDKLLNYAETVMQIDQEAKQTLFDIRELSGSGNYKPVENWSLGEVNDYLQRKSEQIKRNEQQHRHKH